MAAAVLSSVLSMVTNLQNLSPETTTEDDLKPLKQALLRIQPFLSDAEQKDTRDAAVENWLHHLKHTSYDAEDALDDYQLQLQEVPNSTPLHFQASDTIKCITESLNDLARQCKTLNLMEGHTLEENQVTKVSHVGEILVYGREDDKKSILELMLSNPRSNLSVVPVIGVGGVGKTAIASLVYNDSFVSQHFDVRGWVCVSEDFNLVRLLGAILVSVTGYLSIHPELSSLQTSIQQQLEGKRFLLVLDDVCHVDQSLWLTLRDCFIGGLNGSVVLVTTRDESVARVVQTVLPHRVECLSQEDCWLLFRQCAFGSIRELASTPPSLLAIGMGIAKKLRGLPLATKMVSSLLASEIHEQIWHTILHNDLWDSVVDIVDVVYVSLRISYHSLPAHMKRCFAYFALFPKDYLFKREPLVRLWMAEGFLQPLEGKRIEDVGIEYFDEFLRRSFFQCSQIDKETFVMHDLVHDFSESISGKETHRIQGGDLSSITSEARVLSLIPQDFGADIQIQSTNKPTGLRTFVLINRLKSTCAIGFLSSKIRWHLHIPDDMFIDLKCLRTLDLSETDIEELPDSISNLKHLRFLGLNHTRIKILPDSIGSLINLQTLEMSDCHKLNKLPRSLKNLTNLRHLLLPRYSSMVPLPSGISLLTNLQTLSPFCLGFGEQHSLIAELKSLVHLRGELEIGRLENVANIDNAMGALKDKEYLTSLILHSGPRYRVQEVDNTDYSIFGGEVENFLLPSLFGDNSYLLEDTVQACSSDIMGDGFKQKALTEEICESIVMDDGIKHADTREKICNSDLMHDLVGPITTSKKILPDKVVEVMEKDIFECLRPHTNLKELLIWSYQSETFPSWLGDPSYYELVSIRLESFNTRKLLPPLGQLPFLKHLVIQSFSVLESIGHEFYGKCSEKKFPSLETLHFGSMYMWKEWYEMEDGEFPQLQQLNLDYCPKLKRIPYYFPSLKKLVIRSCDELRFLPILPSLTGLELLMYHKDKICLSLVEQPFERLQSLMISGCMNLSLIPLQNISELIELVILNCRDSESPCSTFANQVSKLSCLKNLKIHHCPDIKFSENLQLPSTLQLLDILKCPFLAEWCQRDGSSQLINIPRVILDWKVIISS